MVKMDILLLAPQPFFEDRGTPIAVDLMLQGLSDRGENVDLLTYHIGRERSYPGVRIYRIPKIGFIKQVSPGFSFRKVFCDIFLFFKAIKMASGKRYHYVHAVEEAVFIAMVIKLLFRIPYVYDMDSGLSKQMMEKYPRLIKPFLPILQFFEGTAIRQAKAVVPVCDALTRDISRYNPGKVVILRDVSLLNGTDVPVEAEDLRKFLSIKGPLMMYVGNLEVYQGIDLLLDSFKIALEKSPQSSLVIIGGKDGDLRKYKEIAQQMNISEKVHFLGPKPLERLSAYLAQADVLVSPRIKGNNTPMKIYSYLDSGKAMVATNLPTHTQVLDGKVAVLAEPSPAVFSRGVIRLLEDENLRTQLGKNGKKLVEEKHNLNVFNNTLNMLYDWLGAEINLSPDIHPEYSE
jgi:glycosyltransferase involved in cell wall biosynthesis